MVEALLQSKLYIPPLRPDLVSRPRLIERLNEGLHRPLTLISAPAGFGKSTLLVEWINTMEHPVSWLSLDAGDDDPGRFLAYLIAALQKLDDELGQEILEVLHAGQLPPAEIVAITLINDMLRLPGRCLLVVEDLHLIQDPFILEVLGQLVANIPPPLHLVLSTREDPPLPLARLRANNQLTEIRARELRFTIDDTNRFLNDVLALSLLGLDITRLEEKTEGWIAGLQLAALSIRDQPDPSSLIAGLSGGHRLITSYLTEQVLNRQPEEIRQFLLETAILDRLNGDLCDAVTGRSGGRALLERLFNANLFLVPLDDEGQWYRYHHLFADLLRDRQKVLQKGEAAGRHQKASRWYAGQGMISEAINHALAAEDYTLAVDLLESQAMDFIMRGYAKTANNWLQAIPERWRSQSLRTNLALAWSYLLRGDYRPAAAYLAQVQTVLADDLAISRLGEDGPSLQADWLVMGSLMLYMQGKPGESRGMAARALEIAPEQDVRVRSLAHYALASVDRLSDDFERATGNFQMAIQLGRAADNLFAEMMSVIGLAQIAFEHGRLHAAFDIVSPVIARVERSASIPPICAVLYGVLGDVCLQWYQLEEARGHYRRSLQLSALGGYNNGTIFNGLSLSRLAQLEGDLETAARMLLEAVEKVPAEVPDYVRQEVVVRKVRLHLARNRPGAAEAALQGQGFSFRDQFSFPALPPDQSITYSLGLLYISSLYFLLFQVQAGENLVGLRSGLELAGRLIATARRSRQHLVVLETLLLRAQMHSAPGSDDAGPAAGRADLVAALELGQPEGFIGVFVEQGRPVAEALANLVSQGRLGIIRRDYVERILTAFSAVQSPGPGQDELTAPAELIEPLTGRELEVLSLMAEGLKYQEIADRLFISLNTVRYHVKAVYGKLNVNNRTQAVQIARQRRIL